MGPRCAPRSSSEIGKRALFAWAFALPTSTLQGPRASDWWYCADKCARSVHVTCDGWTLACNGDGGPYWCCIESSSSSSLHAADWSHRAYTVYTCLGPLFTPCARVILQSLDSALLPHRCSRDRMPRVVKASDKLK